MGSLREMVWSTWAEPVCLGSQLQKLQDRKHQELQMVFLGHIRQCWGKQEGLCCFFPVLRWLYLKTATRILFIKSQLSCQSVESWHLPVTSSKKPKSDGWAASSLLTVYFFHTYFNLLQDRTPELGAKQWFLFHVCQIIYSGCQETFFFFFFSKGTPVQRFTVEM